MKHSEMCSVGSLVEERQYDNLVLRISIVRLQHPQDRRLSTLQDNAKNRNIDKTCKVANSSGWGLHYRSIVSNDVIVNYFQNMRLLSVNNKQLLFLV